MPRPAQNSSIEASAHQGPGALSGRTLPKEIEPDDFDVGVASCPSSDSTRVTCLPGGMMSTSEPDPRHAVAEMVRILTRTPDTIRAILEDLPEDLLHADEGEGTFSPFSVLGHLIQGEKEDWLPRARIIVTEGRSRTFDPFDRFAHIPAIEGRTLEGLLDEFATLRRRNLRSLGELLERGADLDSVGTHPELGEVTFAELLATWVVHDLTHLAQIARVVARQFEEEVGPWKEYLPILVPREPTTSR